MRAPKASALLASLLIAAALGGAAAKSVCAVDLAFATGPTTSALSLGGKIVKPARVAIRPETLAGVAGSVTVMFDGSCPSAATLPAALATATIGAVPGSATGFKTGQMQSRILQLASVDIATFKGVFESTGSLTSKGVIPFQIRATEGTVLITNEKTGRVRSAALAPNVMTGAGCSLSADGGDVVLSCPKTVMSHPIVADSITAIVQVKGPLTARGAVSAGRMVNV